jgi:hypothetical protein
MARVQVRGRGNQGEGCEVTRADRPLALKRVGVMAASGRRKRSAWYWAGFRVCVCIDRKTGGAGGGDTRLPPRIGPGKEYGDGQH